MILSWSKEEYRKGKRICALDTYRGSPNVGWDEEPGQSSKRGGVEMKIRCKLVGEYIEAKQRTKNCENIDTWLD